MKKPSLIHPLLICGALLASISPLSAQNTLFLDRVIAQEDVVLTSDVWYGEGPEEPAGSGTFYLDIYRAPRHLLPDELPTIIYLHGGNGDKEAQPAPSYCYEFARRGYVAIAVQYRVGNVMTAAGDVANAIRWVRDNAATYKVDTNRILVGGHSFGGVTSAELTANQSDYFGAGDGGIAATLLSAAALNQFPVNTSDISLEGPPIMIVHGLNDTIATVDGIRSLVTDLDNLTDPVNGIRYPYSYLEVEGAGHAFYPGTGSGITIPLIAGPIDATQGWSNTTIAGKAVVDHVFEFFFEHLNLADILARSPMVFERNSGMSVDDMSFLMSIKHDNRITYQVHSSPDLMIWTPATSAPELNGEFLEVAFPIVEPQMFYYWSLHFDYGEQRSGIEDDELIVTEDGIAFVRTPDSFFRDLPDWPYEYQYVEIDGLRQAYAEAGPADGPVVLLLHGQPTWSYLYRKMIPTLADAGYRVIAMDHLGMGRSDKPINIDDYTYLGHNDRLEKFIQALALQDINLFVQDWGSLIGLRVAGLNPEWFASIAVGNGALPVYPAGTEVYPVVENPDEILDIPAPYALMPDQQPLFYNGCELIFPTSEDGFAEWMEFAMKSSQFMPSGTVEAQTWFPISAAVEAAYDAPFPSRLYMAGTRKFPSLINEAPGATDEAWVGLSNFTRPFVTIWASNDIGEMGSCEAAQIFIDRVPGAAGQPHVRLPASSHFLQDDQGEEIARRLVEFYLLNGIDPSQSGVAIWDTTNGQIVNDGSSDDTGPFAVESMTIAETTIHYPSGIEDIASKFFVIGWGNGSGTNGGDQYPVYFDRLVSYGFVVAASHSPQVNGELILESVQVAMSQNDNPESPLYQKLESHFGVMGKSLGGIAAARAVQDSTDAVASVMIAGSTPGVTDPGLFVTGSEDFMQPVVKTGYDAATGPAIYVVEEGAAHFPDLSESADVADISTAFMRHYLRRDPNTFAYITVPDAQSGNWAEYELKNFGIDPVAVDRGY